MVFENPTFLFPLQLFILVLSIVTALLEIQIEGPHGWAAALPTWKIEWRWLSFLNNGKPLTGYHLYLNTVQFLMFHFPVLFTGWSWTLEWTLLAAYCEYFVFWDFLWFILNPYFGWQRFSRAYVWWFRHWIGHFPLDYFTLLTTSCAFILLRGPSPMPSHLQYGVSGPWEQLLFWLAGMLVCLFLIVLIARYGQPRARLHATGRGHRDRRAQEIVNEIE